MTNEPVPPVKKQDRATPARRSRAMAFILLLGLVSLFGDITYEGAHSFLGAPTSPFWEPVRRWPATR